MLKKSFSKNNAVCKVTFSLPLEAAKGGKDVRLLGDFNQWSWEKGYRMNANKSEFTTEVELAAGKEFQFRYLVDNHIWENDWKADSYAPAAFGEYNSVLSLLTKESSKPVAKAAPKAAAKPTVTVAPKAAAKPAAKVAPKAAEKAAPKAASGPAAAKTTAKPVAKKVAAPITTAKTAAKK